MLHLQVKVGKESFNEKTLEFVEPKVVDISLEHSLVALSKWEAKWHKPFLDNAEKTQEELKDYIKCMIITQNVSDEIINSLDNDNITAINAYINNPMTATTFNNYGEKKGKKEIITSELIYYWMVAMQIPFECQKWHINRLLTLIRICSIKNQPDKKMSKSEIMRRNKSLNAARKAKMHTHG